LTVNAYNDLYHCVGQSKLVTAQIDEDSNERTIMNYWYIQPLSELETKSAVHEVFLEDTKKAFSKMLGAQEVCFV
jgi:coatomer subunit beta